MYPQRSVMTCGLATALEPPHFNHAPVRGAIGASFSRRSRAGSFNPRTRVGCDQSLVLYHRAAREFQSTHPRGVRHGASKVLHVSVSSFNPRTRVGCDARPTPETGAGPVFQSTHPRGVRLLRHEKNHTPKAFQSTHPRGVRRRGSTAFLSLLKFQSTHPRGVRHGRIHTIRAASDVSIHAPAWGATRPENNR